MKTQQHFFSVATNAQQQSARAHSHSLADSMRRLALATSLAASVGVALLCGSITASAATLDIKTATIADLETAYSKGLKSETVVKAYLARINTYDKQGPNINAVITLNRDALKQAKQLDKERAAGHVRGPLHGVPVLLKDNYDTFDLPTTAGSQLLEGNLPPDDAFVVKQLRDAGAIILAKVNLSEWAASGGSVAGTKDPEAIKKGAVPNGYSSAGGQTLNPHALDRGPSGSSGGTGAGIAAAFGQFGMGSDTGGSVRGPSSANGIAGLKPTRGLLSRNGIVPLALSFDTGGPMARSVYDVAVSLGVMTGVDPGDDATANSATHLQKNYMQYLKTGSLQGARIGIARDFTGKDPGVDKVMEASIKTLKSLGAVVIDDVRFPEYLLVMQRPIYNLMVPAEFKAQLTQYLQTIQAGYPKSFDEVVARSNDPATRYRSEGKAFGLKWAAAHTLSLDDPQYLSAKNVELPAVISAIDAVFDKWQLDAIVYPTMPRPADLIVPEAKNPTPSSWTDSPPTLANESGYPDLIVPAGMTDNNLPVTISFFGKAWSEPKLLGYGYDFEQATHAIVTPKHTPALSSDVVKY